MATENKSWLEQGLDTVTDTLGDAMDYVAYGPTEGPLTLDEAIAQKEERIRSMTAQDQTASDILGGSAPISDARQAELDVLHVELADLKAQQEQSAPQEDTAAEQTSETVADFNDAALARDQDWAQTKLAWQAQAGLRALGEDIDFDGDTGPQTIAALNGRLGFDIPANGSLTQDHVDQLKKSIAIDLEAQVKIADMAKTPGENTREVQAALNLVSDTPITMDGKTDPQTEAVARDFIAATDAKFAEDTAPKQDDSVHMVGDGSNAPNSVIAVDDEPAQTLAALHDKADGLSLEDNFAEDGAPIIPENGEALFEQALYDRLPDIGPSDTGPQGMPPELVALSHIKHNIEAAKEMTAGLPEEHRERIINSHQKLYDQAYNGIYAETNERDFDNMLDYMDEHHLPGTETVTPTDNTPPAVTNEEGTPAPYEPLNGDTRNDAHSIVKIEGFSTP